jgi:hypothetical protein
MLGAALAGPLRRHDRLMAAPPELTLPEIGVPLLSVAMVVALSCLFAAGLHLSLPLRVAITVVVIAIVVKPVDDWAAMAPIDWFTAGLAAALVALLVLRWRRPFHWLEVLASLSIVGLAVVSDQVVRLAGVRTYVADIGFNELNLTLVFPAWALAVPVAILAGAALVQVTTSAVAWTSTGLWRWYLRPRGRQLRWAPALLLLLLVAGRAVQVGWQLAHDSEPIRISQFGLAALLLIVIMTACWLITAWADRRSGGDPPGATEMPALLPVWQRWAPALALVPGISIALLSLTAFVLKALSLQTAARAVDRINTSGTLAVIGALGSVTTVAAALLLARRGRRIAAMLLTAFGTFYLAATLLSLVQILIKVDDVLRVLSAATVVLLGWLALRRRLTEQGQLAVAAVLGLGIAFEYRDWINEPLARLLSLSSISAALLVGLVWRILTDNGFARGDSPRFPQSSRVLLVLANGLVGVCSAAQVALMGGRSPVDLSKLEGVGDQYLGFPLVLAVSFAGLSLAVRGREVRS